MSEVEERTRGLAAQGIKYILQDFLPLRFPALFIQNLYLRFVFYLNLTPGCEYLEIKKSLKEVWERELSKVGPTFASLDHQTSNCHLLGGDN
jgi:hypothetical protein